MQYIIHGDDFGKNDSRTAANDIALRRGLIHRTTLLVNMPATEKAAGLAAEGGYADRVSFHLNLSEGRPLTDAVTQTALCKKDGTFCWAQTKKIQSKCMSREAVLAIRAECAAQMRRFRELGFTSKHIDSHDWVLFNLPVWQAVKPLLSEYGFESTRCACDNWISLKSAPLRIYYRFMDRQIGKRLRMEQTWSGGLSSLRKAAAAGSITMKTRAEIVTHPDMADGEPADCMHGRCTPLEELAAAAAEFGTPAAC